MLLTVRPKMPRWCMRGVIGENIGTNLWLNSNWPWQKSLLHATLIYKITRNTSHVIEQSKSEAFVKRVQYFKIELICRNVSQMIIFLIKCPQIWGSKWNFMRCCKGMHLMEGPRQKEWGCVKNSEAPLTGYQSAKT